MTSSFRPNTEAQSAPEDTEKSKNGGVTTVNWRYSECLVTAAGGRNLVQPISIPFSVSSVPPCWV
jgi:hypothetical protein